MGNVDPEALLIATEAVRDEYGSNLCHWSNSTRDCRMNHGSPCLCRQIGEGVLAALDKKGYRICGPNAVLVPRNRQEAEGMNLISESWLKQN